MTEFFCLLWHRHWNGGDRDVKRVLVDWRVVKLVKMSLSHLDGPLESKMMLLRAVESLIELCVGYDLVLMEIGAE